MSTSDTRSPFSTPAPRASSNPTYDVLGEAESQRTHGQLQERSSRVTPNPTQTVMVVVIMPVAVVANTESMDGNITFSHDFICPLSQMIPEDPVLFGGTMYDREILWYQ